MSLMALKKNSQNTRQMDQFIVDSMLMVQNASFYFETKDQRPFQLRDEKAGQFLRSAISVVGGLGGDTVAPRDKIQQDGTFP